MQELNYDTGLTETPNNTSKDTTIEAKVLKKCKRRLKD